MLSDNDQINWGKAAYVKIRNAGTTIFLIAEELGLPETGLRNALETGQYRNKVRNDFVGGIRGGVNGTPAFFVNGVRH
ncbi:MAG: DsbA family protein, partial [Bradyrhizobium sp.]